MAPPPIAELQPMVDHIRAALAERGWNRYRLCAELYGRRPNGEPLTTGSLYNVCNGKMRPSMEMARRWRERTGIDITPWASPGPPWAGPEEAPTTPAAAAIAAYEAEHAPAPARLTLHHPPARQAPPRLAMQINGPTGNLVFTMADQPTTEILRAFQVLSAAGLIEEKAADAAD